LNGFFCKDISKDFFNKATKQFIELERFDYNYLPEKFLFDFQRELNNMNYEDIKNYNKVLAQIIEKTIVKGIIEILNDPEVQVNRGLALKDESDYQTFASTKAKSFGLTVDEFKSLMNSAFIYLPFVTKMEESYKYSTNVETNIKSISSIEIKFVGGIIWYQVETSPNGDVSIRQIASETSKGEGEVEVSNHTRAGNLFLVDVPKKNIYPGKDGVLCTDDDFVKNSDSKLEYRFFTSIGNDKGRVIADNGGCFQYWGLKSTPSQAAQFSALEAFVQNIGVITKALAPFRLSAQILEVQGNKFSFPIGFKEGVHMDDGFYLAQIEEDEDGIESYKKIGYSRVVKTGNNRNDPTAYSSGRRLWGRKISDGDIVLEHPNLGYYTHWQVSRIQKMNIMKDNTYIYSPTIFEFLDNNPEYKDYSVKELHENWDEMNEELKKETPRPVPVFSGDVTEGIGISLVKKTKAAPYNGITQSYSEMRMGLIFPQSTPSIYTNNWISLIIPLDYRFRRNFGGRLSMGYSFGFGMSMYVLAGETEKTDYWESESYMLSLYEFIPSLEANTTFMLTPNVNITFSCSYTLAFDPIIWLGYYSYGDEDWLKEYGLHYHDPDLEESDTISEDEEYQSWDNIVQTTPYLIDHPNFIDYRANNLGGLSFDIGISILRRSSKVRTIQLDSAKQF